MRVGAMQPIKKIACQQVLLQDSSVFSIQWMVLPSRHTTHVTPGYMLDHYLRHINTFTISLIRPLWTDSGLEFRLLATSLSLISFTVPTSSTDERSSALTLRISGGVLVQRDNCMRGELSFITKQIPSGLKVILQLSDYCPFILGNQSPSRWRRILYRFTQAYIHKMVTVRFLARLFRELEQVAPNIRLVKVRVKQGRET